MRWLKFKSLKLKTRNYALYCVPCFELYGNAIRNTKFKPYLVSCLQQDAKIVFFMFSLFVMVILCSTFVIQEFSFVINVMDFSLFFRLVTNIFGQHHGPTLTSIGSKNFPFDSLKYNFLFLLLFLVSNRISFCATLV